MKFEYLDDDVVHADKEWVAFYKGDDSVCIDGTYTLEELRQIVAEVERHLTMLAPDSSKAGDSSLPESVKVENALPAESG